MKRLIIIFALIQSVCAAAQIRISDFRSTPNASAPRTVVQDPDGLSCAAIKLETRLGGWTFDAGLAGVMDTRQEDGAIWIYIPTSARSLTIAHKDYAPLRDWMIPLSLVPGGTYTASLTLIEPRRVASRLPDGVSAPSSRTGLQKKYCEHFTDIFVGLCCEWQTYRIGFSYTWIGKRIGPYVSAATDFDEGYSIVGGAAIRFSDPATAQLDWQLYGGIGLMDGSIGFDVGTRFGWRSARKLSFWDFGFGCQFFQGTIMPNLSVGLCIWGIPTVICIGLAAGLV